MAESEHDRMSEGCAKTLALFGLSFAAMILAVIASRFVGDWVLQAWFVGSVTAFSWARYGPWGALVFLILAAIGWFMMLNMRADHLAGVS